MVIMACVHRTVSAADQCNLIMLETYVGIGTVKNLLGKKRELLSSCKAERNSWMREDRRH